MGSPILLWVYFESTFIEVRKSGITFRSGILGDAIELPADEIVDLQTRVESDWEKRWVVGRRRITGVRREIYLRGVPDPEGIAELIQYLREGNEEGARAWLAQPDLSDRYTPR